jgi:hypothetical protein
MQEIIKSCSASRTIGDRRKAVKEVLTEGRRKIGPLDLGHQSPKVMRASSSLTCCRSAGSADSVS